MIAVPRRAFAAATYRNADSDLTEVGAIQLRSSVEDVAAGHADNGPRSPNTGDIASELALIGPCGRSGKSNTAPRPFGQ